MVTRKTYSVLCHVPSLVVVRIAPTRGARPPPRAAPEHGLQSIATPSRPRRGADELRRIGGPFPSSWRPSTDRGCTPCSDCGESDAPRRRPPRGTFSWPRHLLCRAQLRRAFLDGCGGLRPRMPQNRNTRIIQAIRAMVDGSAREHGANADPIPVPGGARQTPATRSWQKR